MDVIISAGQYVFDGFLDCVKQVNNVVWKNQDEWFPHSTTAGLVALAADQYFRFGSSILIGGSACLTGGLAFTAFQIGLQFLRKENKVYKNQPLEITHVLLGVGTTVAFAYFASVPIVTTVAFAILGWGVSLVADLSLQFLKPLGEIKLIFFGVSVGARGGILYAVIQRGVRLFRPVTTISWTNAMEAGMNSTLITVVTAAIFYAISDSFIENKKIKNVISFAVGVGASCWYVMKYTRISVVTNIAMISLAALATYQTT